MPSREILCKPGAEPELSAELSLSLGERRGLFSPAHIYSKQ